MAGGSRGEPPPHRSLSGACCTAVPCSLGSQVPWGAAWDVVGPSQHQEPMLVLGASWERGCRWGGSKSRLPGVADFVSPSAVLVPGFSLILHGSSTGSCDL